MINRIQNRTLTVPLAGTTITHATTIDASKAVVMLWGGSYQWDELMGDVNEYAWAWPVYPIWGTLNNTNISLTWAIPPRIAGQVVIQVIEYI